MQLLCPDCLGFVEADDAGKARCLRHGEFQVLFRRKQFAPEPAPAVPPPVIAVFAAPPLAGTQPVMCAAHPSWPAPCVCADCAARLCQACDCPQPDGTHLCAVCSARRAEKRPTESGPPVISLFGFHCVQHKNLQATSQCKLCGAYMCETCKFEFPGGLRVCPACAMRPRAATSPVRKRLLIGSFAAAIWGTAFTAALMTGLFAGFISTREGAMLFGFAIMFLLLGPGILGFGLGAGAMDRRWPTSSAAWIATVWNALIVATFVLRMLVNTVARA